MKKKIALDVRTEASLEELALRLKELPRGSSGRVRSIPPELQHSILRLIRKTDLSADAFGRRIGITGTTIRGWQKQKKSSPSKKKLKASKMTRPKSRSRFKEVSVTSSVPISAGGVVVLELAGGAKVHGLNLSQLRELITFGGAK